MSLNQLLPSKYVHLNLITNWIQINPSLFSTAKIASGSGAEEVAEILKMEELPKIAKENLTVISELGQLLK